MEQEGCISSSAGTRQQTRTGVVSLSEKSNRDPIASANDLLCHRGKFFFRGARKHYIRGVTYGTFRPDEHGNPYGDSDRVDSDFAMMSAHGINAVRTYTVPPSWFLDLAWQWHLSVMVGLPWEQHITFLDDRQRCRNISERIRQGVRCCADHPAVLGYAVGNEIPASIVRWHGAKRVERFIRHLYQVAKTEDPDGAVTYVNFPTTEYLELPFLDFYCFNVYLESQDRLAAYLARLQNLAGNKPLIMAEVGLDSRRHGEDQQARCLDWQIRTTFASGCAGMFVFSWTDEWHRGGYDIEDWDFGLTTRDRTEKPALAAVQHAFNHTPFPPEQEWPRISVILCSYNGSKTIGETLTNLQALDYPDFEVIVVNDGSTDSTETIARQFDVRLINVENGGLSRARNIGLETATGEIVAYIDDDAYPDPHWLQYLALTFKTTDYVGVGGPNIQPPGDGMIAECVTNAPGGPIHVLISDQQAEHIPGCNMAFRTSSLLAVGGFDPQFRVAGDDVDVCWRLLKKGWTLGYNPSAQVWHHRRNSIRTYWRQQTGYGKAEALLGQKWPDKYNALGHVTWSGRIYDGPFHNAFRLRRSRIYHGTWGSAPFQRLYHPPAGMITGIHELPEYYLILIILTLLSVLGITWTPLLVFLPFLLGALSILMIQAAVCAKKASYPSSPKPLFLRIQFGVVTFFLCLMQPIARLWGRLTSGLTPWRRCAYRSIHVALKRKADLWSEIWRSPEQWLESLESKMRRQEGTTVQRGDNFDSWDLNVSGGLFYSIRVRMAVEEHGTGKQLIRFKLLPHLPFGVIISLLIGVCLGLWAMMEHRWIAGGVLFAGVLGWIGWIVGEKAHLDGSLQAAIDELKACQEQSESFESES